MALELTDNNFNDTAVDTEKLVVIDFWAAWCGPCRMLAPIIDQLSEENESTALIGKVDVDNNPEISQKYGITNLPTILFLKKGEIVDKQIGLTSKGALQKKIDALVS